MDSDLTKKWDYDDIIIISMPLPNENLGVNTF